MDGLNDTSVIQSHQTRPDDKSPPFFSINADFDPAKIPARCWLVDGLLLRSYMTILLAPGGVGKSIYCLAVAASMASGTDFLDLGITRKFNVTVVNNEDDRDELKRRVAAICLHYNIQFGEITDTLTLFSGYGQSLTVAAENGGMVVATPMQQALVAHLKENCTDAVFIDPFISTHESEENNNNAIDKVVNIYKEIMCETNVAIVVSHHTRKGNGDSETHAGNVEAGRGAKSMTDASRVSLTLAKMSQEKAKKLNIEWKLGRRLMRLDDAKKNFSLADEQATWLKMASHQLPNGDWVGVPEPYDIEPHIKASRNADVKWTATAFAEAIDSVCKEQPDISLVRWANIRGPVANKTGLSESRANHLVSYLSQKKSDPTRILVGKAYIDYWIERDGNGRTAPWIIHRQELSL